MVTHWAKQHGAAKETNHKYRQEDASRRNNHAAVTLRLTR